MTTKDWATKLNGREYPFRLTKEEKAEMAKDGIVVLYGASDDLMEFEGAIEGEVGVYCGGEAYLTPHGMLHNRCDDDDCPYYADEKASAVTITALWCKEEPYSFTYIVPFPHETFDVMEDGEPYCRGAVFYRSDIK